MTVDPVHYSAGTHSIYGHNGVAFSSLSGLVQTLGASCPSGIGYNLSLNKSTWYYWNGSAWVTANGTDTQSNPATTIAAQISSFHTQVGTGTVYFKAYLKSSGTTPCELDNLNITGNQ